MRAKTDQGRRKTDQTRRGLVPVGAGMLMIDRLGQFARSPGRDNDALFLGMTPPHRRDGEQVANIPGKGLTKAPPSNGAADT